MSETADQIRANTVVMAAMRYEQAWSTWANPKRVKDPNTEWQFLLEKGESHQGLLDAVRAYLEKEMPPERPFPKYVERHYQIPIAMLSDQPQLELECKTRRLEFMESVARDTDYTLTGEWKQRVVTPDDFITGHEQAGIIIQLEVVA